MVGLLFIYVYLYILVFYRKDNCQEGLDMAFEQFGIPRIISADHLASEEMDELSGMTYMSYFMSGTL